jgi:hypothetical protein
VATHPGIFSFHSILWNTSKDDYELGDFVLAMDEMSKQMTEDLTGTCDSVRVGFLSNSLVHGLLCSGFCPQLELVGSSYQLRCIVVTLYRQAIRGGRFVN